MSIKIVKIGKDYYNLDFLISAKGDGKENITLFFRDNQTVIITTENFDSLLELMGNDVLGEIMNEYQTPPPNYKT